MGQFCLYTTRPTVTVQLPALPIHEVTISHVANFSKYLSGFPRHLQSNSEILQCKLGSGSVIPRLS